MRRGARLASVLLMAGTVLVAPAVVHAELPLDLSWDAPSECPTITAVRAELERVVRVRRGLTPPRLTARARIEYRDGRWHLYLHTVRADVTGERRLQASTCASLLGAATLVVGLAFGEGVEVMTDSLVLDPRPAPAQPAPHAPPVEERGPPPEPIRQPEQPLPPLPPSLLPPPPPPSSPQPEKEAEPIVVRPAPPITSRAPLVYSLSAHGRSDWGPLPRQAFGLAVGLDVGSLRYFAHLRGIMSPAVEKTVMPDAHLRFAGYGGSLSGCAREVLVRRATVAGCLGLQLTALRGQGVGTLNDKVDVAPLYAALAAVRLDVPLTARLSAQLGAELAASLHRPIFEFASAIDESRREVYRVPRFAPGVSVGLAATF